MEEARYQSRGPHFCGPIFVVCFLLAACGGGGSSSGGGIQSSNVEVVDGGRQASLGIDLFTNGQDAFRQPGVEVTPGSQVQWTYVIYNTGAVPLQGIKVFARQGAPRLGEWAVICELDLAPGTTKQCSTSAQAINGVYRRDAAAQGVVAENIMLRSNDRSFYRGR